MGSMNGVVVSDPFLASQFTQKELRLFKTEFDSLKNEDGFLPAAKLENKISFLEQPLSKDEIDVIMQTEDPHRNGGLDFEGFLRMYLGLQKHGSTKISPQKPTFLRTTTTTWVHTISDSEKKAYVEHINTYLADDYALSELLPIDPRTDDLFEIVKDGILICKLINIAVPGTIDERALNIKTKLNPWERVENHTLGLNSAKAIGCSVVNIGTQDLAEGRPHLVLGLISQIVKIHLLADVNLKMRPELAEMVTDTEEIEELLHLSAEKVLLRWMNFHLKKAGYPKEVSNFSSDLKDGEAYTVLLNVLAPESCDLSPLDINDPQERARAILAQAENIDCRKYVSPRDIWEGSTNLNLAFVANLFHQRNGLTLDSNKISFAEMLEENENDSREERAFRMWINSLGTATHLHDLFGDVRDGWVLLEVLDKVAPGSVNWKLANKPPIKMPFRKVENCNQAVDIGKRLKFSMVNIAGHDVVQGNRKLILAYLWQLMRYNALQLLKNLRLRGKEVSDTDIIEWANRKVKRSGRGSRMESFRDPSLSSGLFFLDLLSAVEPRVVNWRLVTKGETDEDKKQNANYAISVARKLGCSIFLLWDDIVEVRPKMIMILTASIMLWGLSQDAKKAAATASVLELHEDNGSTTN